MCAYDCVTEAQQHYTIGRKYSLIWGKSYVIYSMTKCLVQSKIVKKVNLYNTL